MNYDQMLEEGIAYALRGFEERVPVELLTQRIKASIKLAMNENMVVFYQP